MDNNTRRCAGIARCAGMTDFVGRLRNQFGTSYIALCSCVYGLSQGLGEGLYYAAQSYYFKDVLRLSALAAQSAAIVTHTPWVIKPLYGILSDNFPIHGYQRTYYLIGAALIGIVCFISLTIPQLGGGIAILLMFFANVSLSVPEVVIDAVNAERSKRYPEFASDLQSFSYGTLAIAGALGCLSSGFMIYYVGPRIMFGIISITSFSVFIPSAIGFLGEGRQSYLYQDADSDNLTSTLRGGPSLASLVESKGGKEVIGRRNSFRDKQTILLLKKPLYKANKCIFTLEFAAEQWRFVRLGLIITALVMSVTITLAVNASFSAIVAITATVTCMICATLYVFLYKKNPVLAKATIFLFLRECCQPNLDTAFFYWYTSAADGPHFSPEFVGYINTMSYVSMFIGILIYSKFLKSWKYRTIFISVQLVLVLTNLLDFCLVTRTNVSLGIPDEAFVLGDSTFGPIVKRLYLMPMYVMASKLMVDGTEATLFSVLMSLSNFGYDVGSIFGSVLLTIFGVTDENWTNFKYVLLLKSLLRLLPIFFVPLLVPPGTPMDPVEVMYGETLDASSHTNDDKEEEEVEEEEEL